jgi:hypothetical protein
MKVTIEVTRTEVWLANVEVPDGLDRDDIVNYIYNDNAMNDWVHDEYNHSGTYDQEMWLDVMPHVDDTAKTYKEMNNG